MFTYMVATIEVVRGVVSLDILIISNYVIYIDFEDNM